MSEDSGGGGGLISPLLTITALYVAFTQQSFLTWAGSLGEPMAGLATVLVWVLTVYGALVVLVLGIVVILVISAVALAVTDWVTA